MCVRALRITVLKSAGNFTRDECHDLSAEKIQRVKCFMFTRCGICCVPAIFERRRGGLGSKISGCGQLAEVAVYFAMSGLPPEADIKRKGRHVRWVPTGDNQCARDRRPFRSRVTPVFTRHDFVTTSCRAAISLVVRECRSAGD
jgi:hypothetical protein